MGSGIAKVLSENSPIKVTVRTFAGPNAWMPFLNKNDVELGILSGPDAAMAYDGVLAFPEPHRNVRLLIVDTVGNDSAILVVRRDSGITKTADLKGKRVASDYTGTVIAKLMADAHLATVGLTYDDVRKVPVPDLVAGHKLLREGRADAVVGGGANSPAPMETHAAIGLRALNLADHPPAQGDKFPPAALRAMQKFVPGSTYGVFKKGTGWLDEDAILMVRPIVLVASAKVSDEAAYHVVRSLFENYKKLHPAHAQLENWIPEQMFMAQVPGVPYHPGAVRYFQEKGMWKDVSQKEQQELLARAKS